MKEYVQYYSEISEKPTTDYRMFKRYHALKMKNEQEIIGWKINTNGIILKEYLIRKKGGQIRLRLIMINVIYLHSFRDTANLINPC